MFHKPGFYQPARYFSLIIALVALSACNEEKCREGIREGIDEYFQSAQVSNSSLPVAQSHRQEDQPLFSQYMYMEQIFAGDFDFISDIFESELDSANAEASSLSFLVPLNAHSICHSLANAARIAAVALCVDKVKKDKKFKKHCTSHCDNACIIDECNKGAGTKVYRDTYALCMENMQG